MYSGTPASVALPERSSRGMMSSASTPTVRHSAAVKNARLRRRLRGSAWTLGRSFMSLRSLALRRRALLRPCRARAERAGDRHDAEHLERGAPADWRGCGVRDAACGSFASGSAALLSDVSSSSSLIAPPPCAAARCSRSCATRARGSSTSGSCPPARRTGRRRRRTGSCTSCAWQFALSTDVFGSLPMRTPPSSWMIVPPAAMP